MSGGIVLLTKSRKRDLIQGKGKAASMPVLSRFHGIVIRMYFQQAERNPPHIHALCGEDMAAVEIQAGDILEGHLPPKALSVVREWIGLNRAELLHMWETQSFKKLSTQG